VFLSIYSYFLANYTHVYLGECVGVVVLLVCVVEWGKGGVRVCVCVVSECACMCMREVWLRVLVCVCVSV